MEPTNIRTTRLLEQCKKDDMSRYKAAVFISYALADNSDRVHIDKDDLLGLILNIARNFEDK